MTDRGVIYIATGHPRIQEMAILSIRSLRQAGYDGAVVVISDREKDWTTASADDYAIIPLASEHGGYGSRAVKTTLPRYSRFQETLFLDCDIAVMQPIDAIWQSIEESEQRGAALGMAIDPNALHDYLKAVPERNADPQEVAVTRETTQKDTPFYNSGVIAWRRSARSDAFFAAWHQEWSRFRRIDQFALSRVIAAGAGEVLRLPQALNMPFDQVDAISADSTVFLHFMGEPDQLGLMRADAGHARPRTAANAGLRIAVLKEHVQHEWNARVAQAIADLEATVPADATIAVADEAQLGISMPRHRVLPFPNHHGQYWGQPANDAEAVAALQQVVKDGATFIAFAWPAFWWLEHYRGLADDLTRHSELVLQNDRLRIFSIDRRSEDGT